MREIFKRFDQESVDQLSDEKLLELARGVQSKLREMGIQRSFAAIAFDARVLEHGPDYFRDDRYIRGGFRLTQLNSLNAALSFYDGDQITMEKLANLMGAVSDLSLIDQTLRSRNPNFGYPEDLRSPTQQNE